MYRPFAIACTCLLPLLCTGKVIAQPVDSLYWSAARKLYWTDFQGDPDEGTLVGARTFTTLKYKLNNYDTACSVVVKCIFLIKVSWRKNDDTGAYALQHEQGPL